jgi:dynein heavy chain
MLKIPPLMVPNENGMGKRPDYWEKAKRTCLNDPKLLDNLKNYDKDNIDPGVMAKITPYTHEKSFEPDTIKRSSKAAFGLCKWVRAMVKYDKVAKDVAPRRAALQESE